MTLCSITYWQHYDTAASITGNTMTHCSITYWQHCDTLPCCQSFSPVAVQEMSALLSPSGSLATHLRNCQSAEEQLPSTSENLNWKTVSLQSVRTAVCSPIGPANCDGLNLTQIVGVDIKVVCSVRLWHNERCYWPRTGMFYCLLYARQTCSASCSTGTAIREVCVAGIELKLLGTKTFGDFIMWHFTMIGAYEDSNSDSTRRELVVLTASMEQSLSWKANSSSAGQGSPRVLWNPKVCHCVLKSQPFVSILSQKKPFHVLSNDSFQIHFYITFPSTYRPSKCALSFSTLYQHPALMHVYSPVFRTCSAYLVVLSLLAGISLVTDRSLTPAIQLCLVCQPPPSWSRGCILYIFVVRMRPTALAD